jgi:hypothetical protein
MLNVYTPSGFENYFLAAAIPISRPGEMPPIDLTGFQARTAPLREKFGLIRTGPLKYPFS